jgi:hypothetical protein
VGFELRALHLLGKHSTTWATPEVNLGPSSSYLCLSSSWEYRCASLYPTCSLWDWGLNSRLCNCKAGAVLLEPCLQSFLLWLFWRWGLRNYLSKLASNLNPVDLSLSSSWNYTCKSHTQPKNISFFFLVILGFTLCLLSRHSATWGMLPVLFLY